MPQTFEPNTGAETYTIDFEPVGKRVTTTGQETLLETAQRTGVEIVALCGGTGSCGACRVRLVSGDVTPPSLVEIEEISPADLNTGIRLACQTYVQSNIKIHIPPESLTTPQRLQVEGGEVTEVGDPVIRILNVEISEPDLYDLRSDAFRLRESLPSPMNQELVINPRLLGELSDQMRDQNWRLTVAMRGIEMVAVLPYKSQGLGLAVDIGTTKIAAYLLDLSDGKTLAKRGMMNPQIRYGEDVVSRIAFTDTKKEGRRVLQECLVETLNELIASLCNEAGVQPQQIVEVVTVGNTAIQHFFAGFPVRQLAFSPYVPAVNKPLDLSAYELGLNLSPGIYVHLPANIGGFVGADHVSMMLSTKAYKARQTTLALDIGTNTEISLVYDGKIICCSCASGPAFEGAHIKHGMRAANGAIERFRILNGQVFYQTIGSQPPLGLCGSGILDAVAALRENDIINDRGGFQAGFPGVMVSTEGKEFLLVDKLLSGSGQDITISRRDINEILLAKSAIRTGIRLLLRVAGLKESDIQEFVVAGAFGTYLDIESAITINMFPDLPRERFKQVGNAAGLGAQMMLVSASARAAALEFARRMTYIELITQPDFKDVFMQSMYL